MGLRGSCLLAGVIKAQSVRIDDLQSKLLRSKMEKKEENTAIVAKSGKKKRTKNNARLEDGKMPQNGSITSEINKMLHNDETKKH